jgi:TRAP-type C4-dicarboxylate transport system substrate-binding protein
MAVLQFIMNKDVWNSLSPSEQTILEVWYVSAYTTMRRQADLQDRELVAGYKQSGEVEIVDWTFEERKKFREIAVEAWEEAAAKSDLAQEALNTHLAFMRKIGLLD